ncbi:paraslipin [Leptolyngbya sp. 'hensonii']|uniref:SPFH domain-containing protein n=1 Tax=Leptolyngbya sp. 'hensonii' TaxID=1922337 RepID=UPI00094FAED2|nr:SPFH domain-containing protein [Leptolyngbya sp. 'hensonii']OLP16757.1 paraslipin [Leptolyngbya sp. 'hensonii']
MEPILAALALVMVGYTIGSVKIINEGSMALVERLGRYHRTLKPGLNFVVPVLDAIVMEDTTREQVLDTQAQMAITKDNISIEVDAVIYWRVLDLVKAYYSIDDLEGGIKNLVLTTIRSAVGQMNLEQTFSSRNEINRILLRELDEATEPWGVKIVRVEVQNISPPRSVLESMELQRAAEIKRRAAILEAEGEQQASIKKAEGTVRAIQLLSEVLRSQPNSKAVLQFLVAQDYVDASYKLGDSPNSKVIFMDPKVMTEALENLIETPTATDYANSEIPDLNSPSGG